MMKPNQKYTVFSIRQGQGKEGAVWVKAGTAWVNRDGSLNVYLDVLPLDGKLHVREAKPEEKPPVQSEEAHND